MTKYVYSFGKTKTDGKADMKNLLGGKGANLAEMSRLGIPVPSGFTITTDCCNEFLKNNGKFPSGMKTEVIKALKLIETEMGMKFGDTTNPLLVSSRSGARRSMPGMMETVLNIGLCSKTIPGLIKRTGNERFVYDSYRRLISMYSDVVMEKAEGIEPEDGKGIRVQLDLIMHKLKEKKGYTNDIELDADDLKNLCEEFKKMVVKVLRKPFPDDPMEQLWGSIAAVFKSWNGKRAVAYRKIEDLPDDWGTATNVQAMVFGNMGKTSATGVAFTRNPATGENRFYGEWLPNAQGEDVVAGIRTPNPINEETKNNQNKHLDSLQKAMPDIYKQLYAIRQKLEKHYRDMQDIEFTIQEGTLYMLQTRTGKRTGTAALNMAMDMLKEKLITEDMAVMRVKPEQLDELLHPIVDPSAEKRAKEIARGLPAGPGGATGQIVFTADEAVESTQAGKKVILVREETNPEDVSGMRAAKGILTSRGGMTSHAALVARGWGKCCVVGAAMIQVDSPAGRMTVNGKNYKRGDVITLNGTNGHVYEGQLEMIDATENPHFKRFMKLVDKFCNIGVRANADTPKDAQIALNFGAEGIGLFRTEHMFYGDKSDKPRFYLRQMILSNTLAERKRALSRLFGFVKKDIKATLEVMKGLPVTFRLLDPPLHEFIPQGAWKLEEIASSLHISVNEIRRRKEFIHEVNPMMGHRGVRLGITYPEVTEMQVRAIFEAVAELLKAGKKAYPEIMVPVTCDARELEDQKEIVDRVYEEVIRKYRIKSINYKFGTMIEIPRACLVADEMARVADFFSFGTNDLTQMGMGLSRDDIGSFIEEYLNKNILKADPFQTIDQKGIGQLIETGISKGRSTNRNLKIGICGEHGGDPASVAFCNNIGMDYVSCSPFRVPIARLAVAQSSLKKKI
ncbi:MAG: pyruvate, phosphate dikinase [Deltaproteobacteria bacterium]|nr:pyruvate, phosphate dikinase [Deltaproteobacteria bacterium]